LRLHYRVRLARRRRGPYDGTVLTSFRLPPSLSGLRPAVSLAGRAAGLILPPSYSQFWATAFVNSFFILLFSYTCFAFMPRLPDLLPLDGGRCAVTLLRYLPRLLRLFLSLPYHLLAELILRHTIRYRVCAHCTMPSPGITTPVTFVFVALFCAIRGRTRTFGRYIVLYRTTPLIPVSEGWG